MNRRIAANAAFLLLTLAMLLIGALVAATRVWQAQEVDLVSVLAALVAALGFGALALYLLGPRTQEV